MNFHLKNGFLFKKGKKNPNGMKPKIHYNKMFLRRIKIFLLQETDFRMYATTI